MKKAVFFFCLIAFAACTPKGEGPLVKEALAIQDSARALHSSMSMEVSNKLAEIEMKMNEGRQDSAMDQLRVLKSQFLDYENLNRKLVDWRSSLIEIPGHCLHEEGEAHDHSHDHNDLTDQDILDVQTELYKQLKGLEKQLNATKAQ
jgi:hypothetical protein